MRAIAWSLAVLLLLLTLGRAARSWPRDAHLGYAEGIWLGLAVDASHGLLYRPIEGPDGIGGSRYFPLYYLAIAAGISIGLTPIAAGYLAAAISIGLLISGIYVLLRRLGVEPAFAAVAGATALACQPAQMALLATRGDALAAGLAMWGLAFSASSASGWSAPLMFALAFATKPTSVYAPIAVLVFLLLNRRAADARGLAMKFIAIAGAIVGIFVVASHGRMLSVLAASGGGGASLQTFLAAPISAAHILRRVPEAAYFILLAISSLVPILFVSRRWQLQLHQVAWIACAGVTLAIYASPATIENHLIDLTALSVVLFTAGLAQSPRAAFRFSLLIVGGVVAGLAAMSRSHTEDVIERRTARAEVLAALVDAKSPILFDQPMLAVQRGDAPYVLDQYVTAIRYARDPTAVDSLARDVESKKFGAIVFENQAVDLSIEDAFPGLAGNTFKAALERAYRLDRVAGGRPIFKPR